MEIYDMPGHLIRRLNQISTHAFQTRTRAAGFDLTPVQFAALSAARAHPGADQAHISAAIAYDRATIGGVMDRLEGKGWITRAVSPRDRRAREVRLTADGEEVLDAALPVVQALQAEILPGLDEAERAAFLALARKATLTYEEEAEG